MEAVGESVFVDQFALAALVEYVVTVVGVVLISTGYLHIASQSCAACDINPIEPTVPIFCAGAVPWLNVLQ
jgi:hypothetical protein